MKGWKTWLGVAFITIGGTLDTLDKTGILPPGVGSGISQLLYTLGAAFGIVGIGHKLEKGPK